MTELDPKLTVTYLYRGMALHNLGKYDRAIADYDTAIKMDPGLSIAYYNLARTYARQGENEKAMADLTKAIKINSQLRVKARTDSDFDKIRTMSVFIEAIGQ